MTQTKPSPRVPHVGEYVRLIGDLVEVQDVTPPVTKVEDWIFRDTTARVEMRVNGKHVKNYSTFNNFGGKDSCVALAIEEAKAQRDFIGSDAVEFVVVKITEHRRYRPLRQVSFYAPEFFEFRALDSGSGWDVPDPTEEVVWSSKTGAGD